MKFILKFIAIFSLLLNTAISEPLPNAFQKAPNVQLPISVQRIAFDSLMISSPDSIDRKWGNIQNVEHYQAMLALHKFIMSDRRSDLFSINHDQWSQYKAANEESVQSIHISRLPCIKSVECFLMSANKGYWIVVAKNDLITDYQLVAAIQNIYDVQGKYIGRIASLDTTFGDGAVFQQLPITDFENTGIFCTEYIAGKYDEEFKLFKRRITPEGKIENKQIEGDYTQCKAPW